MTGGKFVKKTLFIVVLIIVLTVVPVFSEGLLREPSQNPNAVFRLFRTTNIWTFLLLDTSDGRIWQLQFDIEGDNRFTEVLSDEFLIESEEEMFAGRFTLYPTTNIYTFILLDQIDGRTWQVQWSQEPKERLVIPIY